MGKKACTCSVQDCSVISSRSTRHDRLNHPQPVDGRGIPRVPQRHGLVTTGSSRGYGWSQAPSSSTIGPLHPRFLRRHPSSLTCSISFQRSRSIVRTRIDLTCPHPSSVVVGSRPFSPGSTFRFVPFRPRLAPLSTSPFHPKRAVSRLPPEFPPADGS